MTPGDTPPPPEKQKRSPGRDLPAAIIVGVVMAALVVATLLWWNWGFILLAALLLSLGAVELSNAMQRIGMRPAIVPIVVGTVIIVVGSYAAANSPRVVGLSSNTVMLAALGLTALAAMVWRMPRGVDGYVKDTAASLFIIGYLPMMGAFLSLLMAPADGAARVVCFVLCIIANDTGGYAVGVLFGKHPLVPKISPKKTWEGLAGSIVTAMTVGALSVHFLLRAPWWVGLILGASLVIAGTSGDLIESLVKRDVGIKDMSSFLPGHGGVMDRLDSMIVGAPIAWIVLYIFVPA